MKVLGDWNWYLPSWLEWIPHVASEGDFEPPVEPDEPEAAEKPEPAPAPALP
jgi:putative drug exporter of the RND superfamily